MCQANKIKAKLRSPSYIHSHGVKGTLPSKETRGKNRNVALCAEGSKELENTLKTETRGQQTFPERSLASRIDLNSLPGDLFCLVSIKDTSSPPPVEEVGQASAVWLCLSRD